MRRSPLIAWDNDSLLEKEWGQIRVRCIGRNADRRFREELEADVSTGA